MPKPTDPVFTWATDANYPAGGDAWSGQPTKVEPSAGEKADGFVPDTFPPAEWFNSLFNNTFEYLQYFDDFFTTSDEIVYPTAKTRTIQVTAGCGTADGGSWNNASDWQATAASQFITFDLKPLLPSGATIISIYMIVNPTSAATRNFHLYWWPHDFGASPTPVSPTISGTAATSSAGVQRIGLTSGSPLSPSGTVGSAPLDFDNYAISAQFESAASSDRVYALQIEFFDPGPRNF